MSSTPKRDLISVTDYLRSESTSPIKREYVGGHVYAAGITRNAHNLIVGNVLSAMQLQLRGKSCRPFGSDTKIRIRLPSQVRFYYPDVSIVCRSNPQNDSFQDEPIVLIEVLSPDTQRIDQCEKKDAYMMIPSLDVYVLLDQEAAAAVAFRRTDFGFVREFYEGSDAVIPLGEVDATLPLSEAYEGVEFSPEAGG